MNKTSMRRAALLEAMILMIAADGIVADEEMAELSRTVAEHQIFEGVDAQVIAKEFKRVMNHLAQQGLDARLKVLAQSLDEYNSRLLAFAFATNICFSDGDLALQELELLKAFQNAFGLREEDVEQVFEAVQNRLDYENLLKKIGVNETPKILSKEEALIELMLLMAASDGEILNIEMARLALAIVNVPVFKHLSEREINEALEHALIRVKTHGAVSRLAEIRLALPSFEDRILATKLAIEILAADHRVAKGEAQYLAHIQEAFDLDQETVNKIMASVESEWLT